MIPWNYMYFLQNWLLDNLVVPVAAQYGMREEYAYLKESISQFPTGLGFVLERRND